jgi:hypothetical protein
MSSSAYWLALAALVLTPWWRKSRSAPHRKNDPLWRKHRVRPTPSFSRFSPIRTVAEAVRSLTADEALSDGDSVVFRTDGRSDFHALLTKHGQAPASLIAFDLLRLDGDDLRQIPLEKRRVALMWLVAGIDGI